MTAAVIVGGAAYLIATTLFFIHLLRGTDGAVTGARATFAVGVVVHALHLTVTATSQKFIFDIFGTLSLVALGLGVAFLLLSLRKTLIPLGAFVAPLCLLFAAGGLIGRHGPSAAQRMESALLPAHIGSNIVGLCLFALAAVVALTYLISERLLRTRNVAGVFRRLPALDVMEQLSFRLVALGFPLLTIGMVTGAFAIAQAGGLATQQIGGIVAWGVFGLVLIARQLMGWRGRRAAFGTVAGFACGLLVLVGYVLQARGGA